MCLFVLASVSVYEMSITSKDTALADLVQSHFKSEALVESSEKRATKEYLLSEQFIIAIQIACSRQSSANTCCLKKKIGRDMLYDQVGYKRMVSRFSVSTDTAPG